MSMDNKSLKKISKEFVGDVFISLKKYVTSNKQLLDFIKLIIPYHFYMWLRPRLDYLDFFSDLKSNTSRITHHSVDAESNTMWGEYNRVNSIIRLEKQKTLSHFNPVKPKLLSIKNWEVITASERLRFPKTIDPIVSIIIPVRGQLKLTIECLTTIEKFSRLEKYEIIIVDDNSEKNISDVLDKIQNIKIIHNVEQQGFGKSCNLGAQQASGKFLLFLNNDVQVTDGWLNPLMDAMRLDQNIGVVGPKILNTNGTLQEAGVSLQSDGSANLIGYGHNPDLPEYNLSREVEYCSAVCIMMNNSLFQELKGFDTHFAPAYYEDVDLCLRVRRLGYSIKYIPSSNIYHYLSATTSNISSDYKFRLITQNRQKLIERWQFDLDQLNNFTFILFLASEPDSMLMNVIKNLSMQFPFCGFCYQWDNNTFEPSKNGTLPFCLSINIDMIYQLSEVSVDKESQSLSYKNRLISQIKSSNYISLNDHPLIILSSISSLQDIEVAQRFLISMCYEAGIKPPYIVLKKNHDTNIFNKLDFSSSLIGIIEEIMTLKENSIRFSRKFYQYQSIQIGFENNSKGVSLLEFQSVLEECIRNSKEFHPPHQKIIFIDNLISNKSPIKYESNISNIYKFFEFLQNALDAILFKKSV